MQQSRTARVTTKTLLACIILVSLSMVVGCSDDGDDNVKVAANNGKDNKNESFEFLSESFFEQGISDRFQFSSGLTLAGSKTHQSYVDLLASQLRNSCAVNVQKEPFKVNGWYPKTAALSIESDGKTNSISVLNAVPYSGVTDAAGINAPVIELPMLTAKAPSLNLYNNIYLKGKAFDEAIADYDVENKVVVVRLPESYIDFGKIKPAAYYLNDPNGKFTDRFEPTYLAALLAMPTVQNVLKDAGAKGVAAILPGPVPGKLYAPYPGVVQNIPSVYLSSSSGDQLDELIDPNGDDATARMTIDADVKQDVANYNVIGLVPGATDKEILLASHTDGFNVVEENGPVALLGLVKYFCDVDESERPVGLRIVMTGSHHAGNIGRDVYIDNHQDLIEKKVIAALEIEHLGALEVSPTESDRFVTTGANSPYIIAVSSDEDSFVTAATSVSKELQPSIVGPKQLLNFGAGGTAWAKHTYAMQLLSGPRYLLSYDVPDNAIANQFVDASLLQRQTARIAQLIRDIASNPPGDAPKR